MNRKPVQNQLGFTLLEIIVVLAIVGIVSSIAYSSYQESIIKTQRTDAQTTLMSFSAAMERHYVSTGTYVGSSSSSDAMGEIPSPTVFASESPVASGPKFYDLRMNTSATAFTLHAIPKGRQEGDGNLRVTSTGERSWDKENNGTYSVNW